MISINEARELGIKYIRMPHWANANDYLELHITESGHLGPWVKLWSDSNEVIGQENPQNLLITMMGDFDQPVYEIWQVEKSDLKEEPSDV